LGCFGVDYLKQLNNTFSLNGFFLIGNCASRFAYGIQNDANILVDYNWVNPAAGRAIKVLAASAFYYVIEYAVAVTVLECGVALLVIAHELFLAVASLF
jgi:hypothetical protein